jgi:hypothetical protein
VRRSVLTLLILTCVVALTNAGPIELIKGVGNDMLQEYAKPLVYSYGVAMTSGLYHTAHAHKFLGFDIGIRVQYVQIPTSAKTFTAHVLACSVNTTQGKVDTFYLDIPNAATIFGPVGPDSSFRPANGITVPPALPGGLGLAGMPFLVPQASVGLFLPGLELMVRGIPYKFQGADLLFAGAGLTEEITAIPGIKLPFNLAVQGYYQMLTLGGMIDSRSYGANIHVSKSLLLFAPYVGVGLDKSTMSFKYDFKFNAPDHIDPETRQLVTVPVSLPVNLTYDTGVNFRAVAGIALKLGPILLNADYNWARYSAINAGLSLAIR